MKVEKVIIAIFISNKIGFKSKAVKTDEDHGGIVA